MVPGSFEIQLTDMKVTEIIAPVEGNLALQLLVDRAAASIEPT